MKFLLSGVESDFDFCQSSIKQVFRNKDISASLMDKFNVKLRFVFLLSMPLYFDICSMIIPVILQSYQNKTLSNQQIQACIC